MVADFCAPIWPERGRHLGNLPGVRVVTGAAAEQLVLDHGGKRVRSVRVARDQGSSLHVQARVTVLAAGGIENARLLLASNERRAAGLGNSHDHVGRWFAEHPHVFTGVLHLTDPTAVDRLRLYQRRQVGGIDHLAMLAPQPEVLVREGI